MKTNPENRLKVILLVEDEETLRRSITFTLMRHGHTVVPYATVDDAFLFVNETPFLNQQIVLIITVLQLPKANGMELLHHIRELSGEIPVLVITGHGNREIRQELEKLGTVQVLDKPFDLEELVTKVKAIIEGVPPESNSTINSMGVER